MKRSLTALAAAGALGLALVSTTQPARAMDPWTAAAWFVGGMFVGGVVAPAYANAYGNPYGSYGYRSADYGSYGYRTASYAPVSYGWTPPQECFPATIRRHGQWRNVRVCY
jgi:hypothetical protein